MESEEQFQELLGSWFDSIAFPMSLRAPLYQKLKNDTFDTNGTFLLASVVDDDANDDEEEEEPTDKEGVKPTTPPTEKKFAPAERRVLVANRDIAALEDVWLIDHCWTTKYRMAAQKLNALPALRSRIAALIGLEEIPGVSKAGTTLMKDLWKLLGSYRAQQSDAAQRSDSDYDSIWYAMDELGSAVLPVPVAAPGKPRRGVMAMHTLPVVLPSKDCVFTIMWPLRAIPEGTVCTTAKEYHAGNAASKADISYLLYGKNLSYEPEEEDEGEGDDVEDEDVLHSAEMVAERCLDAFVAHQTPQAALAVAKVPEQLVAAAREGPLYPSPSTAPLRFYTDSSLVVNYLANSTNFVLVATPEEAEIMWMSHYAMRRSDEFPQAQFVSQFSEERIFTNKMGLSKLIQKRLGQRNWFAPSYDLQDDLYAFLGAYLVRQHACSPSAVSEVPAELRGVMEAANEILDEAEHADSGSGRKYHNDLLHHRDGTNLWILKPCNLARSIDMTVTDHLGWILRVSETGPKVACKYISQPTTLRGRKFDLRFVAILRSLKTDETQLEAFLYNVFWTRFATEQYELANFDNYETHWTVMNYANPAKLLQLHDVDFIQEFDAAYKPRMTEPDRWTSVWQELVYPQVKEMLLELFAAVEPDPIGHSRFRAAYGIDVMIQEHTDAEGRICHLQPVLLEVTFSPDCHRACKYHPSFYEDVFSTLFLGKPQNVTRL